MGRHAGRQRDRRKADDWLWWALWGCVQKDGRTGVCRQTGRQIDGQTAYIHACLCAHVCVWADVGAGCVFLQWQRWEGKNRKLLSWRQMDCHAVDTLAVAQPRTHTWSDTQPCSQRRTYQSTTAENRNTHTGENGPRTTPNPDEFTSQQLPGLIHTFFH